MISIEAIFLIALTCATINGQATQSVTDELMNMAAIAAAQRFDHQKAVEAEHEARGFTRTNSYHAHLTKSSPEHVQKAKQAGFMGVEMAKYLQDNMNTPFHQFSHQITPEMMRRTSANVVCPQNPQCDPNAKYRNIDGSCNNLRNPSWGRSMFPLKRLIPPVYDNGLDVPRSRDYDNQPLPNVRKISSTVGLDVDRPSSKFSNMLMEFGQFLAHDISKSVGSTIPDCCNPEVIRNLSLKNLECYNIEIPKDDYFYSQFNHTCMKFLRTSPALGIDCRPGPREQVNELTAFIDASTLYASTQDVANSLRTFQGGKLKSSPQGGSRVLPPDRPGDCNTLETEYPCLKAGDGRVNENLLLSLMHQIFFREHNRIAGTLARMNPTWREDDERLYQETRRIVIAEMQHISYNEYLPLMLGDRVMRDYGLTLNSNGYSRGYDETVDATVSNIFSTTAFRIGHTQVQGNMDLLDETRRKVGFFSVALTYNRPLPLYDEQLVDQMTRGVVTQPTQNIDNFFSTGVTNHLHRPMNQSYGLDLIAFNMHRGRDHGTVPYVNWRVYCGQESVRDFNDLYKFMDTRSVDAFKSLYRNVSDIDVFIAMNAENPEEGALVGPLARCLLTKQFRELKLGDRFWYENGNVPSQFTERQLQELRKSSLARILCDNTNVMMMQKKTMIMPSAENPTVPCLGGLIPRVNLELWNENVPPLPVDI